MNWKWQNCQQSNLRMFSILNMGKKIHPKINSDTETIKWIRKDFKIAVWNWYGNDTQYRYSYENIRRLLQGTKNHFIKPKQKGKWAITSNFKTFYSWIHVVLQFVWIVISCSDSLVCCWHPNSRSISLCEFNPFEQRWKFVFLLKTFHSMNIEIRIKRKKICCISILVFAGQLLIKYKMSECKIPWYISTWLDSHEHYSNLKWKWIRLLTPISTSLPLSFVQRLNFWVNFSKQWCKGECNAHFLIPCNLQWITSILHTISSSILECILKTFKHCLNR